MKWIALLRGINISGQKIIRMQDLREICEKAGLQEVETYIQSGNIVFKSALTDRRELEILIAQTIKDHYGFDVPVWVIKATEIARYLELDPFADDERYDPKRRFYCLLDRVPDPDGLFDLWDIAEEPEVVVVIDRMVYLFIPGNAARTKLSNNLVEKVLKCRATTRNQNTLQALLLLGS